MHVRKLALSEIKKLTEQLRIQRCWGNESAGLLEKIDVEKRKMAPPQELQDTLLTLRQEFAKAAASQKRNRNIFFLGEVYRVAAQLRNLRGLEEFSAGLVKHYEVDAKGRDIFQLLLVVTCGELIDRKIRHRWAACLRRVAKNKTPPELGAAQIIRLGGINKCGSR